MSVCFGHIPDVIRHFKNKNGYNALIMALFAFVIGAALQIQTDIAGIRINMADLLIPFAGVAIGVSLLRRRSCWPQWNIPYAYPVLAALAGWMVVSFINGYFYIGGISHWALYNKVLGFTVLLAYFALGGWLYSNYKDMALKPFIRGFLLFFAIVLAGGAALVFAYEAFPTPLPQLFPFEALMGNRNAYSLLIIAAVIFLWGIERRQSGFIPAKVVRIQMIFLPLVLAYNGSRAGWIIFLFVMIYFLTAHFKWFSKTILPWLLMGSILAGLFFSIFDTHLEKRKHLERITGSMMLFSHDRNAALGGGEKYNSQLRQHASELIRMRNVRDSLALWKESPLAGAGLGALLHYQHQNYDPETTYIDIMDCSPVWLLTETGLVGLGLFLVFYILVLRALWIKRRDAEGIEAAFAEALFVFLLAFGAMSLLHEIIYTRFLWLMMGMGVAVAAGKSKSIQNQ